MELNMQEKLRRLHRTNRMLWASILLGMIIMGVIVAVFHVFELMSGISVSNVVLIQNISTVVIILLLFLIMYIKRTYLLVPKIVERASRRDLNIVSADVIDFVNEFGEEASALAKGLIIMRRYYMLIWSIANLIVMIGFIQYIVMLQLQSFVIYAVVGIFSLMINFPRYSIIEAIYYRIENEQEYK